LSPTIARLHDDGYSLREISKATGIPKTTVQREVKRLDAERPPSTSWGDGRAKLVKPSVKKGQDEVVCFITDIHAPFHDQDALESALELVRALQPNRLVNLGDTIDAHQISRFWNGIDRAFELQADLDAANEIRKAFRQAAPNAVFDECEGNHDNRFTTYIQTQAKALVSLDSLKPESLFKWKELGIRSHNSNGFLLRPEFLCKHGSIARQEAGATAKAELALAGISGISGHVHRLITYAKEGYVRRQWTEAGCLCRLDPDYTKGQVPNWTSGMCVGTFSTRSNAFVIETVQSMEGKFIYGGRTF
jgi:hypothetical protein